jgi:hypothetical protein
MDSSELEAKIAFAICISVVLMRFGNTNYNLVQAKIQSNYNGGIYECLDHPEYLRKVLKEVYEEKYNSILEHIRFESDHLVDIADFKADFFRIMTG